MDCHSSLVSRHSSVVVSRLVAFVALAVALIAAVAVQQPAFAHGNPKPKPSCFYYTLVSNTQNIVINGSTIGTYEADIQYNSCQSSDHRAYGAMHVTGGGCASGSINTWWTVNGTEISSGSPSISSIGPNSCSTNYLSWQSSSYIGTGYNICVYTQATYSGNALSPQASICKTV